MAKADSLEVSVVVPCHNCAKLLSAELQALSQQTFKGNWEIIAVDNGSSDGTAELLREWQERLPNLRVIKAVGQQSASYARNVGLQAAKGACVLFCDADDLVENDWVHAMVVALKGHDLVGGAMAYDALNLGGPKDLIFIGNGVPIKRSDDAPNSRGLPAMPWNNRPFVPSGNLGVRRPTALAIGGFDPSMDPCEDQDFSWRAADIGATLGYAPGAIVQIRQRDSFEHLWRQRVRWGSGSAALFLRHREKRFPVRALLSLIGQSLMRMRIPKLMSRSGRRSWVSSIAILVGQLGGLVISWKSPGVYNKGTRA